MELADEAKQHLAEEIASWNDVSNWTFVPKSLLKHLVGAEGKAGVVYEAIVKLNPDSSNLYPDTSTLPLPVEVMKLVDEAKQDMDEKRLLFIYFREHMDALMQKAYANLALDFLNQLKAKVPEQELASTLDKLIEGSNAAT